jgi:hypothetical protein
MGRRFLVARLSVGALQCVVLPLNGVSSDLWPGVPYFAVALPTALRAQT